MSLGRPAGLPPGKPSEPGSHLAPPRAWTTFVHTPSPLKRPSALLGDLLATLFPAGCRVCDAPLLRAGRIPVCELCLAAPRPSREAQCFTCGEDLGFEDERASTLAGLDPSSQQQCNLCRRLAPPFVRAVSFGTYAGELRSLLHLFKYESVPSLARPLGGMLAESIARLAPDLDPSTAPTLVVPVPLATRRARERGYNQTDLLAREALRHLGPAAPFTLAPTGLLRRTRETESQFGLNPRQRRLNVRGAFSTGPDAAAQLAGRDCLLIDDIFTTGATARACATVLQQAGARQVLVATLARAQPESTALWDSGST